MIQVIKEDMTNSEENLDRIQHDVLRPTNLRANTSVMWMSSSQIHFSLKRVMTSLYFTLKFNIAYIQTDLIKQTSIRNHQTGISRMQSYFLCSPEMVITISFTQETAYVFFFWLLFVDLLQSASQSAAHGWFRQAHVFLR